MKIQSSLVLEGGGLRGVFTGGFLEYLLENDIFFNHVVGVSAGACTAASYLSRQIGRNKRINVELPEDPRFVGLQSFLKTGSFFGMEFIFDEIPNRLVPHDRETMLSTPENFDVIITSREDGRPVVFDKSSMTRENLNTIFMATSSIPLFSPPVLLDGKYYYDGGVSASIPFEWGLEKSDKIVVILTRERSYRKGRQKGQSFIKWYFRDYPEFTRTLLARNDSYNRSLDKLRELEKRGQAYVIAPDKEYLVDRMERKTEKLLPLYEHGYALAQKSVDKIHAFLKG